MKFCAKCGRKGETREGLCDICYSELRPSLDIPKQTVIKVCEGCGKFLHRNLWSRYPSTKDAVESIVKDSIKTRKKINVNATNDEKKVEAEIETDNGDEKYRILVKLEEDICNKCRKLIGKYFEGTLQLRDVDDTVLDYVAKDIESRTDEGVFVKEMIEYKNGLDITLTSRKYLMGLGKKLKKRFGGTVKRTSRLFSINKQTSKEMHRLTVLYRGKPKPRE